MSEAPERIWIEDEFGEGDDDQWVYGTWDVRHYAGYNVEYVRADRIEELEGQRDLATSALMYLERCAQVVSERGAVTGPQWTRLTVAILKARSALNELPNPAPSKEPRLVQSETALAELKGEN